MTPASLTPPEPAAPDPTIVIVGGVAGGASAAARARRVNERARIVVLERDAHVSFANCGLPYFIGGEIEDRAKLLIATPELFRDRFRIEVRVRQEALAIDRATKSVTVKNLDTGETYIQGYDKLILSPGASPIVPSLPGAAAPPHASTSTTITTRSRSALSAAAVAADAAAARAPPHHHSTSTSSTTARSSSCTHRPAAGQPPGAG